MKLKVREFQLSSNKSSSWFPLTQNLANNTIVSSTISQNSQPLSTQHVADHSTGRTT